MKPFDIEVADGRDESNDDNHEDLPTLQRQRWRNTPRYALVLTLCLLGAAAFVLSKTYSSPNLIPGDVTFDADAGVVENDMSNAISQQELDVAEEKEASGTSYARSHSSGLHPHPNPFHATHQSRDDYYYHHMEALGPVDDPGRANYTRIKQQVILDRWQRTHPGEPLPDMFNYSLITTDHDLMPLRPIDRPDHFVYDPTPEWSSHTGDGKHNLDAHSKGSVETLRMPTFVPLPLPSLSPTAAPVTRPKSLPTPEPVTQATPVPTRSPVAKPSQVPTPSPVAKPSPVPTPSPVARPTPVPTRSPVAKPSPVPTPSPVARQTPVPTRSPVAKPSPVPTPSPVIRSTPVPTRSPASGPNRAPSAMPTSTPPPSTTRDDLSEWYAANITTLSGIKYLVVDKLRHDPQAFTQGLTFANGKLYESAGLYDQSTIRILDPNTGDAKTIVKMDSKYFAEGWTIYKDKLVQIVWKHARGFVYDAHDISVPPIEFTYKTTKKNEGWGITYDSDRHYLIVTDGSANLIFWDPDCWQTGHCEPLADRPPIRVTRLNGAPALELNEIEYWRGRVLANVWYSDVLLVIHPDTGNVEKEYDFSTIYPTATRNPEADVFNGISVSAHPDILYVTGKQWDRIFKVKLLI